MSIQEISENIPKFKSQQISMNYYEVQLTIGNSKSANNQTVIKVYGKNDYSLVRLIPKRFFK